MWEKGKASLTNYSAAGVDGLRNRDAILDFPE
jgi:hypothetical protein